MNLKCQESPQNGDFYRDIDTGNSYVAIAFRAEANGPGGPLYWQVLGGAEPAPLQFTFSGDGSLESAKVVIAAKIDLRQDAFPAPESLVNFDGVPAADPTLWEKSNVFDQDAAVFASWDKDDFCVVLVGEKPRKVCALGEGGSILLNQENELVGMLLTGVSKADKEHIERCGR